MRMTTLMILIMIFLFMMAGQAIYKEDVEMGEERDIYNLTESTFQWNYNLSYELNTIEDTIQVSEYNLGTERFKKVTHKFVDFIGYSFFEGAKWGIEYGYTHPEYDLRFFLDFLIKILWIGIIIAVIPLIVPLIALIYLFFKGICCLTKKILNNKKLFTK